jgi:pimeloyl-ACP methyl ester carboxylesterase
MSQINRVVPKKRSSIVRRLAKIAAALVIILALLVASGIIYQVISEASDLHRYLPPGSLYDVGGYRLQLNCSGNGSPTIILESGLGGPGLQWLLVQQELAKSNRVCSYDRAGLGWSDAGPRPRTSQQMVKELHALLQAAGVPGPYVLVGHSLGGFNVRLYAHQYPTETAAVVLVAAGSEDDYAKMPPEYQKIDAANRQSNQLLGVLSRLGLTRLAGKTGLLASFTGLFARFPPEAQAEMEALTFYRSQYWATSYDELSAVDQSKSQVAAAGSLGSLPLVVLSASPDVSRLPASFPVQQIVDTFRLLQDELAGLSTNTVHIVCDTCDHYVPMTDPARVVDAINQALARVKP